MTATVDDKERAPSQPGQVRWATRTALTSAPAWVVAEWVLKILLSIYPAATVVAIRALGEAGPTNVALLAGIALIFGLSGALQQASYAVSRRVAIAIETAVAIQLASVLAAAPAAWLRHPHNAPGIRAARQATLETRLSSLYQAAGNIVAALIVAVSLSASLWPVSPAAAVCSVFAALPTVATYMWVGKKEGDIWEKATAARRRALYLEDQLGLPRAAAELSLLGGSGHVNNLVAHKRLEVKRLSQSLEDTSLRAYAIGGVATAVVFGITIVLLARPGNGFDIAAGIVGILASVSALGGVGFQLGEMSTSRPAVRSLHTLIDSTPTAKSPKPAGQPRRLETRDLSITYPGAASSAVRGVDLVARAGEVTAIVGANGSGKTTIINAIVGALDYTGQIIVDGAPIPRPLAMGVQLQSFGTFELSVRDFVCMGGSFSDEHITHALIRSGAHSFVEGLPSGLDTQLGEQWGGVDLSGGQWQRLSLARLFLHNHGIWVLDEPTSAVDAHTEELLFEALAQAKQDTIIVVITHRASVLTRADVIYVLEDGRVVETGDFETLRSAGGPFYRLFRSQLHGE